MPKPTALLHAAASCAQAAALRATALPGRLPTRPTHLWNSAPPVARLHPDPPAGGDRRAGNSERPGRPDPGSRHAVEEAPARLRGFGRPGSGAWAARLRGFGRPAHSVPQSVFEPGRPLLVDLALPGRENQRFLLFPLFVFPVFQSRRRNGPDLRTDVLLESLRRSLRNSLAGSRKLVCWISANWLAGFGQACLPVSRKLWSRRSLGSQRGRRLQN